MKCVVALLLILLAEGFNCQLVFKDSPASSTVLTNFPTTLRCSAYEPHPPYNILWFKDNILLSSDPRGRFSLSYNSSTGRSEYVINTVSYLDDGEYQCIAVNATDAILASSDIATLTVQGYPGFVHPLPSVTAPLGASVVFDCPVLSNPPATVSWAYQDNTPVHTDGRIFIGPPTTLTIHSITHADARFYVCIAVNDYGMNTTSGRLTIGVPSPPLALEIIPPFPETLVLTQGESFTLTCSVNPSSLFSSLTWSRGSQVLSTVAQTSSSTLVLSIASVSIEDSGVYTCTATDSTGAVETMTKNIEVDVPPEFTVTPADFTVVEGQVFDFPTSCIAVGEPQPVVTWLSPDNRVLSAVNGVPQLGVLTRRDAGVYACEASNNAGSITSQFTITIQGPPVFTVPLTNTEAGFGQDVTLQCVAEGPPSPSYSWSRQGLALPNGSVVSADTTRLLLFSVTTTHNGVYQCVATNSLGSNTVQASLTVLEPPQITDATYGPLYLETGSNFTLVCSYNYTGPPSVAQVWSLNGTPLNPAIDPALSIGAGGSLTVTSPGPQYSGEYTCNVTTSFAFDLVRISVFVGSTPDISLSPSDTDLPPSSTAVLSCEYSGQPEPWSTWFKTSPLGVRSELSTVGPRHRKLSTGLELFNVVREDSGFYECVVDNGIGAVQQSATVRVEGIPEASAISPNELVSGEANVSLTCQGNYNWPLSQVSWRRLDGVGLSERITLTPSGQLLISQVTGSDQAEYECTLSNFYGVSSFSSPVTVLISPSIVLQPSHVFDVNSEFSLVCESSGEPSPTVQWLGPDGSDASSSFSVDPLSGQLSGSASLSAEGTYTCIATSRVGTTTALTDLFVRGPPVSSFIVNQFEILGSLVLTLRWQHPATFPSGFVRENEYQLEITRLFDGLRTFEILPGGIVENRPSLSAGLEYMATVRPVYVSTPILNGQRLLGRNFTISFTTSELAPSGAPQNIMVAARSGGFNIVWTLPAVLERNGVITSYTILYRLVPVNVTADPPFSSSTYIRNLTEVVHTLTIDGLEEIAEYQVKLAASTAAGTGPESPLFTVTTSKVVTYLPVDLELVVQVFSGVVGAVMVALLVLILVLFFGFISILCWRRRTKFGKHKPLTEERAYDKRRSTKRQRTISGPVPGITPKFDDSTDGKFSAQGQDGRVLKLPPKVIMSEDVAAPPRPGQNVRSYPSDEILVSQAGADNYDQPADAVPEGTYSVPNSGPSSPSSRPVIRPDSGVYSEVYTGPTEAPVIEETDFGEPQLSGEGREAVTESQTNLVDQGLEGGETGLDSTPLIYASVSDEHKQMKREKMAAVQDDSMKLTKKELKMQQKLERERKKQEEKRRKQEEKEFKKRAKEQAQRASMGLDNVVHLHELDFNQEGSRAHAQFIDAATAALF